MITCAVHDTIDPDEIEPFERFAREWPRLATKHGGTHHGYESQCVVRHDRTFLRPLLA